MKLEIELVPKPTWGWNVRSELTSSQWNKLRKAVYLAAEHRCEICGGAGSKHPVECHEKWQYQEVGGKNTQMLVGLIALCPKCHMVAHLGLSFQRGYAEVVINHLRKVNGSTLDAVEKQIRDAFLVWSRRSQLVWDLDITWLRKTHT